MPFEVGVIILPWFKKYKQSVVHNLYDLKNECKPCSSMISFPFCFMLTSQALPKTSDGIAGQTSCSLYYLLLSTTKLGPLVSILLQTPSAFFVAKSTDWQRQGNREIFMERDTFRHKACMPS